MGIYFSNWEVTKKVFEGENGFNLQLDDLICLYVNSEVVLHLSKERTISFISRDSGEHVYIDWNEKVSEIVEAVIDGNCALTRIPIIKSDIRKQYGYG